MPWFVPSPLNADPGALVTKVAFPCVIKPVALSGSRGVMRADNVHSIAVSLLHSYANPAHENAIGRALSRDVGQRSALPAS